jgi:hypothetical protein
VCAAALGHALNGHQAAPSGHQCQGSEVGGRPDADQGEGGRP